MIIRKSSLIVVAVVWGVSTAFCHDPVEQPPWQQASGWPDRVVATLAADPTQSFSVSWRTDISVGAALGQVVKAQAAARFDLDAETIKGEVQYLDLDRISAPDREIRVLENQGLPAVHYHSVTFTDLEPDTLYAYRVRGQPGQWTAWRQLRTAPKDGPVQFIFFGDAQTAIRSHVTRAFDTASMVAPNARFAIHGGDLVNTAMYDKEWAEWFEAIGRTHAIIPSIPVAGNHDYVNFDKDKARSDDGKLFVASKTVSPIWRPQFTLPVEEELPKDLWETVYDIRYGSDLHVFVLDSSGIAFDKQLAWLERKLKRSDAKWKVLTMHHPLFSFVGGREHPAHKERRTSLLKLFNQNLVDIVLTGHRHTYQRGAYGENVARFSIGEPHSVETVFVVTASSTKRGETKVEGWQRYSDEQEGTFALSRHADNIPIFAIFDIEDSTLRYRAVDATAELYDGFTLTKAEDGQKTIQDGEAAKGEIKDRSNTGRYIGWDDLR